jgi:SAM-dependent methyltransferase
MASTAVDRPIAHAPWFASWFDSPYYHRLYANRDEREASAFIDRLVEHLRPAAGSRVLDLGCGAGRHSRHLAAKKLRVVGLDLSARSIAEAKRSRPRGVRFVRHDMREPFGTRRFDYVFNFFTSFGYFDNPSEHWRVVRNIADSLRDGGTLVLDYVNVHHAAARLTPREVRTVDGLRYRLTRWTDGGHFFKRIAIEAAHGREPRLEYVERVARFGLSDFRRMFAAGGLAIERVHGDYDLRPYDAGASPRLIMVARKAGALLPRQRLADAADGFRRHAEV